MDQKERKTSEVARNRKAKRDYETLETFEAGISLLGTEVKTLRDGRVSLEEAFVRAQEDGLWLEQAFIDEYRQGNVYNHEPTRKRQLLVKKNELMKIRQKAREKGLTLIPLKIYFHGKWAKLLIGLCKGRTHGDKRQVLKDRQAKRDIRRATKGF